MKHKITFLEQSQIWHWDIDHRQLDVLKKYGTKCAITDFAILLGCWVSPKYHTSEGNTRKDRTGWWWIKASNNNNFVRIVGDDGDDRYIMCSKRIVGARPVLPYSSIQSISSNGVISANGIKEIFYGEYPQTIVDENYSYELEEIYLTGNLNTTGKHYTTDSVLYTDLDTRLRARTFVEYEYNGSKYIRFVADWNCRDEVLSDGQKIQIGNTYWVRVEPIIWFVDEKEDIALSKYIIFSGVQFDNEVDNRFENTDIKQFMDNYFVKEIIPSKEHTQSSFINKLQNEEVKINQNSRNKNPYGFNFAEVSEEEIIKGAIESKISVFLHGRSSEGKSARVKQLDPDCEIIYMRNATPDSLNGKSVYNASTGEMIDVPPTWYTKVVKKCESEPDKLHIIFFDELTNALPSIQGMAFNIILDGEVNGKWKLPENARIVAAGNDLNDSLAANQMAEPLFNRFAHVYIETTVDSWLKWASDEKNKIHPAIYAYVAYKSYSGQDVLRTPYTGDKPNADPRKWEMASKVLNKTNNPQMLRSLIGEELTRDFTEFVKLRVITIEDVINHNYNEFDLKMDVSQKFATAIGLSSCSEDEFETVREFMKLLGAEPRAAFESIWAHGDEKRLEQILEIQMNDNPKRKARN